MSAPTIRTTEHQYSSADMITQSLEICNTSFAETQHGDTTFATKQATNASGVHAMDSPSRDLNQGEPRYFSLAPARLDNFIDREDEPPREVLQHIDDTSLTGSPMTNEAWTGTEDSDTTSDTTIVQNRSSTCLSSSDILSWSQNVVEADLETLLLTLTPFERGVISSYSVNDILMIKGLIPPLVYIQFLDLSKFS